MTRPRPLLGLIVALSLAVPALGEDDAPGGGNPQPPADAHDLILLTEERPLFLRLHIEMNARSCETAWREAIDRLHNDLDLNQDGRLSETERVGCALIRELLSPQPAERIMMTRMPAPRQASVRDAPRDVETPDDLARDLRSAMGPVQVRISEAPEAHMERFFAALDVDGDGCLSPAEAKVAEASVRVLDRDDNGTIARDELRPFRNRYLEFQSSSAPQPAEAVEPFALLAPREQGRATLARQLIARYDRPQRDSRLSRDEIGMDLKHFERADRDDDGAIDAGEIEAALVDIVPDFELNVQFPRVGAAGIDLAESRAQPSMRVRQAPKNVAGGLVIVLEKIEIELVPDSAPRGRERWNFLHYSFRAADDDKSQSVDADEAQRHDLFPQATFRLMDRDRDGKLIVKEMQAFLERDADLAASRTIVSALDQGRSLFHALDADADGRLTVRELRALAAKLRMWDRDGDGRLSAGEIPRHYRLTLGRDLSTFVVTGADRVSAEIESLLDDSERKRRAGPAWFEEMDRNRDGDLSRREFLGSLADFNRLDTDHDGLIDAQEAARAQ